MRPSEVKTRINGVVYYLLGCVIVLYFFPRDLAALSIIYLSWTDPTASIFGRLWGRYTPQYSGKSLAGTLGASITGALVTYVYFGPLARYPSLSYNINTSPVPLFILSAYGGLVAGFSEGVSNLIFNLDDNLTIPVLSVILLYIPLVTLGLGQ
jgi:diacylglycerol kinase (CTP)